jgi:hypothetical protein
MSQSSVNAVTLLQRCVSQATQLEHQLTLVLQAAQVESNLLTWIDNDTFNEHALKKHKQTR